MTLAEKFSRAFQDSKTLTEKPSNELLLKLYSTYKQATVGDCNINPPGGFDLVGQAKYNAWKELEGTSKEDAMRSYVDLVSELKQAQA